MKPLKELIDGTRKAVMASEVRENIAQIGEYVEQLTNAAGAQGPKGDKGDPGPKGDKGDPGEGFTSTAKELMLSLFENATYKTGDAQDTLNALRAEWGGGAQEVPVQSASCAVTVAGVETAELIYDLPGETALSFGFDTGLKLLDHAATETPQYTILLDLKPSDSYEDTDPTPQVLYCMKEASWKQNGFKLGINPNNGTLPFIYYSQAGLSLCDTIEHFKMRTRYVIQIDGKNFRGGSTHLALSDWNTTPTALTDVPGSMIIGGARDATSDNIVQCLHGTLYQCKVYKGLLSDAKVKAFIKEGTV